MLDGLLKIQLKSEYSFSHNSKITNIYFYMYKSLKKKKT